MEMITKVKVQKNHLIARKKDVVMRWFIVLEGSVLQRNSYAKVILEKNSVIGISESGRYLCDYVAASDSVLAVFSFSEPGDLKAVINGNAGMRGILLRAAVSQRQLLLKSYAIFQSLVRQFHSFVESENSTYMALCAQYGLPTQSFTEMERFKPLEMVHRAENWEINNSISLMHHLEEFLQLMQKDDNLCIGAIMEACYQSRRVMQGTVEMVNYLVYNKGILLSESENDMFHRYLKLLVFVKKKNGDISLLAGHINKMTDVIRKTGVYDEKLVAASVAVCRKIGALGTAEGTQGESAKSVSEENRGEAVGSASGESAKSASEENRGEAVGSAQGESAKSVSEENRGEAVGSAQGESAKSASEENRGEAVGSAQGESAKSVSEENRGEAVGSAPEESAENEAGRISGSGISGESNGTIGNAGGEEMKEDGSGAGAEGATREEAPEGEGIAASAGEDTAAVADSSDAEDAQWSGVEMGDDSESTVQEQTGDADQEAAMRQENCLQQILDYAGFSEQEKESAEEAIARYQSLPDVFSADKEIFALRKELIKIFYDVYFKIFMRTMEEETQPKPVIRMFLNFGFMDERLAGEENTGLLYGLAEHLDACRSEHVYTIYEWLKSIYNGENQPSKNEFDLDYPAYLADLRKNGKITADQEKRHLYNQEYKVRYELQNMFASGNRATYGKMSAFCPMLGEYDLINSADKMLVTAQRLEEAMDKVRQIDFSVFYREIQFSDPAKGINREMIMKEVIPDIILMPNAGTRAMMWQETVGVKKDTPARFLFPVFTVADIDDLMMETMGRYRWEICRKIQGVHWNDIREKSLTSEFCDYLQFYRKNNEISPEVKEKIKSALLRGRNNFREVFVKDYQSWIKYESRGSYRLNKVSRAILIRYCPFAKRIREELKSNPMYQNELERYDLLRAKTVQRIRGVYEKYQRAGGMITKELEDNMDYYDL